MNFDAVVSKATDFPQDGPREEIQNWKNSSFLGLLLAQFISLTGTYLNLLVLPWIVLELTGSPSRMTLVILAMVIPGGIIGIPAGSLVDRLNTKWLLVVLDIGRGVLALVIPYFALENRLEYWMIIAVTAVSSVLTSPYASARMLIVPLLVGERERDLARANTLLEGSKQLAKVTGPAMGGLLIAQMGNINVLFLNVGSYFIAAFLLMVLLRYRSRVRQKDVRESLTHKMDAGLRFIMSNPSIRIAIAVGMFAALAITTLTAAVLPIFVKDILQGDASLVGLLIGIWGGGAALGMLAYSALASRWPWPPLKTLSIFLVGMTIPMWFLSFIPTLFMSLVSLAIASLFSTSAIVAIHTLLQNATPAEIRGRVFSTFQVIFMFGAPLGLLVAGPVMEQYGVLIMLWGITLLLTLTTTMAWSSPALRLEAKNYKTTHSKGLGAF